MRDKPALFGFLLGFLAFAHPTIAEAQCLQPGTVRVYLNWQTFLDWGIAPAQEDEVGDAVINSVGMWERASGLRMKFVYMGHTTRTVPANDNDVIVRMNESHCMPGDPDCMARAASTYGTCPRPEIVIHRKDYPGGTNTNWSAGWGIGGGRVDVQAILMHEFGHALDLPHNADLPSLMFGGYNFYQRFGPTHVDRFNVLQINGGMRSDPPDVHLERSTDHGGSWAGIGSNIAGLAVDTFQDIGATRDHNKLLLTYTSTGKSPCWIIGGDNGTFDTGQWFCFGGLSSHFGTTISGESNEYMMTYVDPTSYGFAVKVLRSTDGGTSWSFRNPPPDTQATGTPSIFRVSTDTWILAYPKYTNSDDTLFGLIATRVSTNDGASWGAESYLSTFYHANQGVSVTANGSNVRIGFAWADSGGGNLRQRWLKATLSGGTLSYDGVIYTNQQYTRWHPGLGASSSFWHMARVDPGSARPHFTNRMAFTSTSWDFADYAVTLEPSGWLAAPAIAADRDLSFVFAFYTKG